MLCYHCMHDKGNAQTCPHCHASGIPANEPHQLPPGAALGNRYIIGRVLGEGGFGITYLGFDRTLRIPVAVKEYYPISYSHRDGSTQRVIPTAAQNGEALYEKGKDRFLSEARNIARFYSDPGIVSVSDFFDMNNTAYIIMEYLDGIDLRRYLKKHGVLTPDEALRILTPVMRSLERIHKANLIHRDVSPDNIMVLNNGSVKLMDFGCARAFADDDRTMSVMLKHGYAPYEQYRRTGKQGPWTDVYAFCATFYRCITGKIPPYATDRIVYDDMKKPSECGVAISSGMEQVLLYGLAVRIDDRCQSMTELIGLFEKSSGHVHASEIKKQPPYQPQKTVPSDPYPTVPANTGPVSQETEPIDDITPVRKAYDSAGNVIKEYNAAGHLLTEYEYASSGQLIKKYEYDGLGNVSRQLYYDNSGKVNEIMVFVRDTNGHMTKLVDYDSSGNVKFTTEYECTPSGKLSRSVQYDPNGKKVESCRYEYGPNGKLSKLTAFDSSDRKKREVDYRASGDRSRVRFYKPDGSLIHDLKFEYDADGRLLKGYDYDNNGKNIYINQYTAGGMVNKPYTGQQKPQATKKPNAALKFFGYVILAVIIGFTVFYVIPRFIHQDTAKQNEYDAAGHLLKRYDSDGDLREENEYDDDGNMVKSIQYYDNGNIETEVTYDASGNDIKTLYYDEDGTETSHTEKEYDGSGNLTKCKYYNTDGTVSYYYEYKYDSAGNRIRTIEYDSEGKKTGESKITYDADDREIRRDSYDADGNLRWKYTYEYDASGKMTKQTTYDARTGKTETKLY